MLKNRMRSVWAMAGKLVGLSAIAGIVLTGLPLFAAAASYQGRGSKSDPYLIATAVQLQGMTANLSAHYKLVNTIDLSGVNFKAVGWIASPFTGSLTCDTNSNGTPKYAIKNLTVSVEGAANYADYVENNSKWECGLFGTVSGATITNIAILNATITNTVIGKNQMNADWSLNPGQDEMGVGILAGIAKDSTFENCSSRGIINSRSNSNGGLIGAANNITVKKCYSTATVNGTGLWLSGGLVGYLSNSEVSDSFATGSVSTGANSAGGLIGNVVSSTVKNSYSTGSVNISNDTCNSLFGSFDGTYTLTGCYASGKCGSSTALPASASGSNYILNAAGCKQAGFTPASQSTIDAGMAAIKAKVAVIANESAYVPQPVSNTESSGSSSGSGNSGMNGEDTAGESSADGEESASTASEQTAKAEDLKASIDALAEAALTNSLTQEQAFTGIALKTTYATLNSEERAKLTTAELNSMSTIYEASIKVLVATITDEIIALPGAADVTADNAKAVLEVWNKYQKLPEGVRAYFTTENAEKLSACYEAAKGLSGLAVNTSEIESTMSALETVIVVVLAVVNGLALIGFVILLALLIRTYRTRIGGKNNHAPLE